EQARQQGTVADEHQPGVHGRGRERRHRGGARAGPATRRRAGQPGRQAPRGPPRHRPGHRAAADHGDGRAVHPEKRRGREREPRPADQRDQRRGHPRPPAPGLGGHDGTVRQRVVRRADPRREGPEPGRAVLHRREGVSPDRCARRDPVGQGQRARGPGRRQRALPERHHPLGRGLRGARARLRRHAAPGDARTDDRDGAEDARPRPGAARVHPGDRVQRPAEQGRPGQRAAPAHRRPRSQPADDAGGATGRRAAGPGAGRGDGSAAPDGAGRPRGAARQGAGGQRPRRRAAGQGRG
ncbi:hypothetical protein EG878_17005, partial [Enterococcus faecalis]